MGYRPSGEILAWNPEFGEEMEAEQKKGKNKKKLWYRKLDVVFQVLPKKIKNKKGNTG
jgi:hypothetical protein